MALSMLGYSCCSDLDEIPEYEFEKLMASRAHRIFNAYVNIGSLRPHVRALMSRYPRAKFIVTDDVERTADRVLDALEGADVVRLNGEDASSWRALCQHLRLPPPATQYPVVRGYWTAKISARCGRYAIGPSSKATPIRSVTVGRRAARGLGRNQREHVGAVGAVEVAGKLRG